MELHGLSDAELKAETEAIRKQLEAYEKQVSQEDNSADRSAMRALMTHFNHLKIEAKRRGIEENF